MSKSKSKRMFSRTSEERKKEMNPEFARWRRMYVDQEWNLPATEETVYWFFHHNMYVADNLKIMTDQKRLRDRCMALVHYLNKTTDGAMYLGMQHSVTLQRERMLELAQAREDRAVRVHYMNRDSA